jgi:Zn-dependent protease/predicted transcriptional regulator
MIQLLNIRGVTIRAHGSAAVFFVLLFFLLGTTFFPQMLPNQREQTYWSAGFICTLWVYLSFLAHELGRTLVARWRGVPAETITLVMMGARSDVRGENARPMDEVLFSAAGPVVSLVLAVVFGVARFVLPGLSDPLMLFLESILLLNIWLGLFNLLPSLPLDGGRVVRGLVWQITDDYSRATWVATLFSRGLAFTMLLGGLVLLLAALDGERSQIPPILGFDPRVFGVITMVAAWFLNNGARGAYRQVQIQNRFRGVPVSQLMSHDPPTTVPWTRLDEVIREYFVERGERAVLVVRDENLLMGLVTYADARKVPRAEWAGRAVGEVMTPVSNLITVSPEDNVETAVRHMAERHFNQLPVVADGRIVGLIARVNVIRYLNVKEEIGR